jgi:hypothetical protein
LKKDLWFSQLISIPKEGIVVAAGVGIVLMHHKQMKKKYNNIS